MNATLFLALVISQPPAVPSGPPMVPQGPPMVPVELVAVPMSVPEVPDSYENVLKSALRQSKPAIIFVGQNGSASGRDFGVPVISASVDSLVGVPAKSILVSVPYQGVHGEQMEWKATLGANATDKEIRAAIEGKVAAAQIPFSRRGSRRGEVQRVAETEESVIGRLPFLSELVPYNRATQTQITFRRVSGYIAPSPRSRLENKWIVPGHLDGVHGWSSELLKSPAAIATVGLVRQNPNDGLSAVTWNRSYPDGSVFADVLRNERGKIFEARIAEKNDGAWTRYVAYHNTAEAPANYIRPTSQQCIACHNQSGVSAYAGAAIPGGDTILSEAYDHLERGQIVQGGRGTQLR